ncbi:MAG: TIGR01777 family oxidoreductase [Acidobacteria bacterium]|nr:TIGR01777 family oxidoreductase [Acidobacteriota bacterium]
MTKIIIAGGTGLIGGALARRLADDGHDVVVLSRSAGSSGDSRIRRAAWQPDGTSGAWAAEIDGAHAIVNFTGAGIADRRWTDARKRELRASRVLPTRSLVAAVRAATRRPAVFVQGSAVGYYGTGDGAREVDESFPAGRDFLGELCQAWEAEAQPAAALGCRLVTLRTGVVVSSRGGVVARLKVPFLLFAGGPIGSGRQYLSWIHEDDLVSMVLWAIATPAVEGVYNATSPNPVTNARFSAALGRALHRPSVLPVPPFFLRLVYGEMAQAMLIEGQRVVPRRAVDAGFVFRYPEIDPAVAAAVKANR